MAGGVKAHAQRKISLQGEPHSRTNLGGREGWTTKERGTQHRGSCDRGDTDTGSLSDGDDGASSSQESVLNDPTAKEYAVETMELQPTEGQNLFHEPLFSAVTMRWKKNAHRVTQTRVTHTKVWNTPAQLIETPLVGNIRELTLLDDRARQPLGEVAFQRRQDNRPVTEEDGRWLPNKDWPKTPTSGNWDSLVGGRGCFIMTRPYNRNVERMLRPGGTSDPESMEDSGKVRSLLTRDGPQQTSYPETQVRHWPPATEPETGAHTVWEERRGQQT
jgi:hypothetical protein